MAGDSSDQAPQKPAEAPRPGGRPLAFLVRGGVAGLLVGLGLHVGYVLGGSNFRTVLPGQVYRCAQPSPEQLARLIRRLGIRTVVNLRGCCPTAAWYRDEAQVAARLGVSLEDLPFSATRLPSSVSARLLLDVLDRSERPLLFHCHQGADRTGMAAVMALLLLPGVNLAEARRQLGPAYGHLPLGKPRHIDRFFELYEGWLAGEDLDHSPDVFRDWVRRHYCPGEGRAELTLLEPLKHRPGRPPALALRAGRPRQVRLRCGNTSLAAWAFQPGTNAGVHAWWSVHDRDDRPVRMERAGLFHATVQPGGHIDLVLPLPGLPPGRYELRVDLASEQHAFFLQVGNDLLVVELEVT
jgi:protein tyrosine phosphatase (PTP) superfamily phosphohydrolase (DUF442 family)